MEVKPMNPKKVTALFFLFAVVLLIFGSNVFAQDQYTDDLCTNPSKASASSTYEDRVPARAFDNIGGNYAQYAWEGLGKPAWLMYDFGSGNEKKIEKVTITATTSAYLNQPYNWKFQASNNAVNWVDIYNVVGTTVWTGDEKREYTFSNDTPYRYYRIYIIDLCAGSTGYPIIGEIEMMEKLLSLPVFPTNLVATAGNAKVDLFWGGVEGATGYNVKRATTAGGPYETIASYVTTTSYTDAAVNNGTTYYYVVTVVNTAGESANSNEASATLASAEVTLTVDSVDKAKVGDEITANIVIHNATNICAEDIKITYDTSLLEYIRSENANGMKVYKEADLGDGSRRFITASLGKANAANGDKILLKLKFKAKAAGQAKVDIVKGRIADNATVEMDVTDENCGEKIILIESLKDVNRTGEFTLLDLGIDAWYFGDAASATDSTKYDADIMENGAIDDEDLMEIVNGILNNSNYPANT